MHIYLVLKYNKKKWASWAETPYSNLPDAFGQVFPAPARQLVWPATHSFEDPDEALNLGEC